MRRVVLSVMAVLSFAPLVFGAGRFTPYTQSFLDKLNSTSTDQVASRDLLRSYSVETAADGEYRVDAFVEVENPLAIAQLEQLGAVCGVECGNLLTISVPLSRFAELVDIDGVATVDIAQPLRLLTDKVRNSSNTNVDALHKGTGLDQSYMGAGVIYGTIDTGIDFNHYAFKDADGNNRILYVYLPDNTTGTKVHGTVYDGYGNATLSGQFPGSEFSGSAISTLKSDYSYESHGTHTMSTGAGSYMGNAYYGMAPEADIVACGTSVPNNVKLVNAVSYIFQKADELGKPAVVNISLGVNLGPHDGSAMACRVLDKMVGPGKVVVMAAGNEGEQAMHVSKTFTADDTELLTFLKAYDMTSSDEAYDYQNIRWLSGASYQSYQADIWVREPNQKPTVNVVVYDKSTKQIVSRSADFTPGTSSTSQSVSLSTYVSGSITLYGTYSSANKKYNVMVDSKFKTKSTNYLVGLAVRSAAGTTVDLIGDGQGLCFGDGSDDGSDDGSVDGFTAGDYNMTINDYATTDGVISVGAYVSRQTFTVFDSKSTGRIPYGTITNIAPFSSYGPDANGIQRPDVCAPGFFVIAAINNYDTNYDSGSYYRDEVVDEIANGTRDERWALMYGTSMAAPVVSGIIATWLQADPNLSVSDVREILYATSKKNIYYNNNSRAKWGAGMIDALAGIKEVLSRKPSGVVSEKVLPVMVYPNPSEGVFDVVLPSATGTSTISVFDMSGRSVFSKTFEGISLHVDASGVLSSGVYVVRVLNNNTVSTSRLIVK